MRTNEAAVTRGRNGSSDIKKELRERDKDESWKNEALKDAKAEAKQARRPGASLDEKTRGLSVPKQGG